MESFKQPDLNLGTDTGIHLDGPSIAFKTGGATKMILSVNGNIGIGETEPNRKIHIKVSDPNVGGIRMDCNTNRWKVYPDNSSRLYFLTFPDSTQKGMYIQDNGTHGDHTFTGQHINMLNTNINDSSRGLIVSSSGNYLNLDNSLGPSINEALPICTISNIDNDKKVFGVISDKEDSNTSREYSNGNVVSIMGKTNTNEERMFINSLGEGSMWVCNKNGTLQNGDYITSTTVSGYGGKQITIEGALMNFTVSKITCDCDFSLTKIVKQKLKVTVNSDGTNTIDYDSSGNVQYVDDLDSEGNQQMVYPLETRFLQADGTQLVDEADYNTRLANGESVYIACFVGCTYHCG